MTEHRYTGGAMSPILLSVGIHADSLSAEGSPRINRRAMGRATDPARITAMPKREPEAEAAKLVARAPGHAPFAGWWRSIAVAHPRGEIGVWSKSDHRIPRW